MSDMFAMLSTLTSKLEPKHGTDNSIVLYKSESTANLQQLNRVV